MPELRPLPLDRRKGGGTKQLRYCCCMSHSELSTVIRLMPLCATIQASVQNSTWKKVEMDWTRMVTAHPVDNDKAMETKAADCPAMCAVAAALTTVPPLPPLQIEDCLNEELSWDLPLWCQSLRTPHTHQ